MALRSLEGWLCVGLARARCRPPVGTGRSLAATAFAAVQAPAYNRTSARRDGASERGAPMRLFGSAMVALLVAFSGAASADSGVSDQKPSVSAHLDFSIVVTSVLALDEAARRCGTPAGRAACRAVTLAMPGGRAEHRTLECVHRDAGRALICTTSSP